MSKNKAISYIIIMLVLGSLAGYCLGLNQGIDRAIRISDVALNSHAKPAAEETPTVPDDTLIYRDAASGFSFRYPASLGTRYVTAADWPPSLNVSPTPFTCMETAPAASGSQTAARRLDGRDFCVTTSAEGAAGSTYTTYAYATAAADKTVTFNFTLRTVRCENFDKPERSACTAEQRSFSPDNLAARLAASLKQDTE